MSAPLIFIHYGDSYYLRHTLKAARMFNPDKRVILLGDAQNAKYAKLGVEHFHFADYRPEPALQLFEQVYEHTAGARHGRQRWTRFVFERWFHIYGFLVAEGISRFWTFDTDTVILTRLSGQERKFAQYDCTEQCSGICMNGFIANVEVVKGYLVKINELFQRKPFMDQQRARFEVHPEYAFTEMLAYVAYRDEASIRRTRLSSIIDGETFVDSICTLEEHRLYLHDDEYEIYDRKVWGKDLKKLYLASDGSLFLKHRPSQSWVKVNSLNLSWVPESLFRLVLRHAQRQLGVEGACRALLSRLSQGLAGSVARRREGNGLPRLKVMDLELVAPGGARSTDARQAT